MMKALAMVIAFCDGFEHLIQQMLIITLNPIARATRKIKKQDRNILLFISFIVIAIYFILIYSSIATLIGLRKQLGRHIIGLVLLLAVIVFSVDREQSYVKWKKIVSVPLIGSGVMMLIVSFIHPIGSGYRVFAIMLIFVFPAIALVWNNRKDYYVLFNCMGYAIAVVGIGYLLICIIGIRFGWATWEGLRFKGTMSHSGNLSQLYTSVFCSGLFLFTQNFRRGKVFIFASIIIGIATGMLLLGQGRSCALACIASLMAMNIFFTRYVTKGSRTDAAKKIIIAVILIVLTASLVAKLPALAPSEPESLLIKTAAAEKGMRDYTSRAEIVTSSVEGEGALDNIKNRFSGENKDLNQFSSGRIYLWKLVLQNLNWMGHDVEEQSIHDLTQNDWLIYAHNVFLEISYRCGIPLGIVFLLLEYTAGCISLRYLFFNKKGRTYLLFPIMITIVYISQSMLDCAGMPFILESGLYYYFALIPMMDRYV